MASIGSRQEFTHHFIRASVIARCPRNKSYSSSPIRSVPLIASNLLDHASLEPRRPKWRATEAKHAGEMAKNLVCNLCGGSADGAGISCARVDRISAMKQGGLHEGTEIWHSKGQDMSMDTG